MSQWNIATGAFVGDKAELALPLAKRGLGMFEPREVMLASTTPTTFPSLYSGLKQTCMNCGSPASSGTSSSN